MGNSKKDKHSRRKFLSFSFLKEANKPDEPQAPTESGEKVKMLTPDGKLVEVDKSVVEHLSTRKKAKNKDILKWTKAVK